MQIEALEFGNYGRFQAAGLAALSPTTAAGAAKPAHESRGSQPRRLASGLIRKRLQIAPFAEAGGKPGAGPGASLRADRG